MTLNDLDRSSGPTLVEISTSEGNLVELDGLQGKGKAVGRGLGQRVESCDYWSSGPCSEHNTWCMLRWGSSKGWPASPATLERMARTTSCAVKDKRHKTHKKEWFSARAQIFMDQIALNSIEFIPEDSNIGNCIVSVKKPALERPKYASLFLMGCLTSVDSRRILRSYRSQRLCSQNCVH